MPAASHRKKFQILGLEMKTQVRITAHHRGFGETKIQFGPVNVVMTAETAG